jgi:hypothetical protein
MSAPTKPSDSVTQTLSRMVELSVDTYYNPYKTFDWPEALSEDQWWMSPDLTSTHDTELSESLSPQQKMALSKWESVNFYGLIVYGIRELMLEVAKRIYAPGFEFASEYFHHFLGEENGHMWFFAKFCLKYGSKLYPDKRVKTSASAEPDIEAFVVFSRILIFEELGDYFNIRMGKDESLAPIIRDLNNVHHQDESRHIAFGRQVVKQLYEQISDRYAPEKLAEHRDGLKAYMNLCIQNLYNPSVYKDAGLAEPYKFRRQVLQDPARKSYHRQVLKRTTEFFLKNNILQGEDFIS